MKVIRGICRFFTWLCMALIIALMLLMVAEVLRRALFNRSILGSTEWAQVLLLCNMTAFGASVLSNRQIKVDIVTSHLKPKAQVFLDIVVLLVSFATIGILAWQQFNFALKSFDTHIFYTNINMPQWPFVGVFALSYGVAALCIICLVIRKIVSLCTGRWDEEARMEDMDEIFVFGRRRSAEKPAAGKEKEI